MPDNPLAPKPGQEAAPILPGHLSPWEVTESMSPGDDRSARQQVETAIEMLRDVPMLVEAQITPFREKHDAILADADLSVEGRTRKMEALQKERDEHLAKVRANVDKRSASLDARFDRVQPQTLRVQASDEPRVSLAIQRSQVLTPAIFLAEFNDAVARGDRVMVQQLLPVLRSKDERGEMDEVDRNRPMSEGVSVDKALAGAERLLVGSDTLAGRYWRDVVKPAVTSELDIAFQMAREEWRWTGSSYQRITRQNPNGSTRPNVVWLRDGSEEE